MRLLTIDKITKCKYNTFMQGEQRAKLFLELYRKGYTLQSIGDVYKLSRQRVYQIIKPYYHNIIGSIKHYQSSEKKTVNLRPSESLVLGKLTEMGFKVVPQTYCHYYDLLVNNKYKIEVKHQAKKQKTWTGHYYYKFSELVTKKPVDFYILICGSLEKALFFIVPADKLKRTYVVSAKPTYTKSKQFYSNYLSAWHLLN